MVIIMVYFVFTTTDRTGITHVEPSSIKYFESNVPSDYVFMDTEYCIELSQYYNDYKDFFIKVNDTDPHIAELPNSDDKKIRLKLYSGFSNYPIHKVNKEKLNAGQFPFEHFDPRNVEYFKRAKRRRKVTDYLQGNIAIFTEIKKLRLAIKCIIEHHEELLNDERVKDFIGYSNFIEQTIAQMPKEKLVPKMKLRINEEDIHVE